jgi:hypothetical protein
MTYGLQNLFLYVFANCYAMGPLASKWAFLEANILTRIGQIELRFELLVKLDME